MSGYDRVQAAAERRLERDAEAACPRWKRNLLNDINRDRLVRFIRQLKASLERGNTP